MFGLVEVKLSVLLSRGGTQQVAGWRWNLMCGSLYDWVGVELSVWLEVEESHCVTGWRGSSLCDWMEEKLIVCLCGGGAE